MESPPQIPKSCIESPLYEKNKQEVTTNIELLDDSLSGIIYTIACDPTQFPIVDEANQIRTAKSVSDPYIPALVIFFKEYDNHIVLLDIEINPEEIPF